MIAEQARPFGAHDVVLYLIDYEQRTLVPLGDPRRDDLKPLRMRVGLGIDPRAELRGYFRPFAESTGSSKSSLKIDVVFYDAKGKLVDTKPYDYSTTSTAWQPTGTVKINVFTPKTTVAAAPIAFCFTASGSSRPIRDRRLRRPVGPRLSEPPAARRDRTPGRAGRPS